MATLGRVLFALSIGFFGIQDVYYGHFLGGVPPAPPWTPGGHVAVYVLGAIFIVLSLLLLANRESRIAATVIGLIYLLCVLILHTQKLSDIVHDGVGRTRAFEPFAMAGAAFALAALVAKGSTSIPFLSGAIPFLAILGRYIVAFSLIVFGVQHFLYAQFIAFLVPAWMPAHLFLAYVTGAALIAAGLAIGTHIFSRLASMMLGLLFVLWLITLHVPRALAAMRTVKGADEWSSAFVALGFAGASFVFAAYSSKSRAVSRIANCNGNE
jgi:uncharacterized membrane protein